MYWPELIFSWGAHEPSTADDARRLSQFVTGLPDFDPIYQSWLASPAPVEEAVPVPLTEPTRDSFSSTTWRDMTPPTSPGRRWEAFSLQAMRERRPSIFV